MKRVLGYIKKNSTNIVFYVVHVVATLACIYLVWLGYVGFYVRGWHEHGNTDIFVDADSSGKARLYYFLSGRVEGDKFRAISEFIDSKIPLIKVTTVVIDIHSGGGAVFEAIRAREEMRLWRSRGIQIHTVTRSFAASAAAMVFLEGDRRMMSQGAWLMHHSIQVGGLYTPNLAEKIALHSLQEEFNKMWTEKACLRHNEAAAMFNIPFGSDRQVWLPADWAYRYCLAEYTE